jgi:hypothetical protein
VHDAPGNAKVHGAKVVGKVVDDGFFDLSLLM